MCPQGQNAALISCSQHREQVRASCSLWSFSFRTQVSLQPTHVCSSLSTFVCLSGETLQSSLGLPHPVTAIPALNRARRARSYTSLDVRWMSKMYLLPRSMLSLRKREARWPLKSRLYCIFTELVTVSHLKSEVQIVVLNSFKLLYGLYVWVYMFNVLINNGAHKVSVL